MSEKRKRKQEETRSKIIDAAIAIVGRRGYAKASMSRIADEAGIAYGSIYQYFENQHDLFENLLPEVRNRLSESLREYSGEPQTFFDRESASFGALIESSKQDPFTHRVFTEAPFFVPDAYDNYLKGLAGSYVRAFRKCVENGEVLAISEDQFEAVAYMLMGAKQFLLARYVHSMPGQDVPQTVCDAYDTFIRGAVYGGGEPPVLS